MVTGHQLRLRLSLIDGPELRCLHCGDWWPIDTEHWEKQEWHMCLPCKRDRAKLYQAMRQSDAEYRSRKQGQARKYRKWLRENCPQYLGAYEREQRARNREDAQRRRDAKKEKAA